MTEWGVVTVLVTVVGLFAAVGAPVLKLNSTITRLQTVLDDLRSDFDEQKSHNSEGHKRLWEHNDKQDEQLDDHEKRITRLEG